MTINPDWTRIKLSSCHPSSLFGEAGMHLREFHSVSNTAFFFQLLECLYDSSGDEVGDGGETGGDHTLPVLLPGTVLRKVRELFVDQHGSVVMAVRQMKLAFAHHFTQKGTCRFQWNLT